MRLLLIALALPGAAAAADPTTRFELGWQYWDYDVEGLVENQDNRVEFPGDLDVKARSNGVARLRWDTGPGLFPDVAAGVFNLDAGGQRQIDTTGGIGPIPIPGGEQLILADADVRDLELSLRYPVLDGPLRLSVGATIKQLDGTIATRNEEDTESATEKIDEVFPLVHAFAEWRASEVLSVDLLGNWIARGDDEVAEIGVALRWRVMPALSLNAGWQHKQYTLASESYRVDTTLDGALIGAAIVLGK